MLADLKRYQIPIFKTIDEFLYSKKSEFGQINNFGPQIIEDLIQFSQNGKMIRGSLIAVLNSMFTNQYDMQALQLAAAFELFHSAFLIHDDIMDQGKVRRGKKTVYFKYKDYSDEKNLNRPNFFGEGAGICIGDLAFFLGFELLSAITDITAKNKLKMIELITKEFNWVGLAQIQDLYFGYLNENVSESEIFNVYKYKTSRYTFSLPFILGALLSGQDETVLDILGDLGEKIGIIFQIMDDTIEIFGDEASIGKDIGSDIKEGKKTLFYHYLFARADETEQVELNSIFYQDEISTAQIERVQDLIAKLGVQKTINQKIDELNREAVSLIEKLPLVEKNKKSLLLLLEYNLNRKK